MPNRRTHEHVSELFFGKRFSDVHIALDSPSRKLGPSHRRMFHSHRAAVLVARAVSNDPDAPLAAILHVDLDRICSEDPYFESFIELRAKLARRRSRDRRRLLRLLRNR
ncbi:hypothetical protein E6H34_11570 [Candidatus Bathyarchaeota archaeon]|nr:MAG: hypothetical protein E6H34_11570 [Candidatus Bathyarchaeota archaeon]